MAADPARRLRLPRELRHPLFLGLAALYLFSLINRHWHWLPLPAFVNSHLADFLYLPLELTVLLWFMRRIYFRQPRFVLPGAWVLSTFLVSAVWFEGIVPRLPAYAATADPFDVLAYALGGLLYWRWLNRPDVGPDEPEHTFFA